MTLMQGRIVSSLRKNSKKNRAISLGSKFIEHAMDIARALCQDEQAGWNFTVKDPQITRGVATPGDNQPGCGLIDVTIEVTPHTL